MKTKLALSSLALVAICIIASAEQSPTSLAIGLESSSLEDYGVTGIPHAFVVNQAGKIVWHGHPAEPEMENAISSAVNEAK